MSLWAIYERELEPSGCEIFEVLSLYESKELAYKAFDKLPNEIRFRYKVENYREYFNLDIVEELKVKQFFAPFNWSDTYKRIK